MKTDDSWYRLLAVTECGNTNVRPRACAPTRAGPAPRHGAAWSRRPDCRPGEQAVWYVGPGDFEINIEKDAVARRPVPASGSPPRQAPPGGAEVGASARPHDEAVVALYHSRYAGLVRLAASLVGDVATAEDVVQDSFIATYQAWWRLRDTSSALAYLRSAVMNGARSVLRQRVVADRHAAVWPVPDVASAEEDALATLARSSVRAALHVLSPRQRQVILLRYYSDVSEAQIAGALGVSTGAVKSHASRALDSLRAALR